MNLNYFMVEEEIPPSPRHLKKKHLYI